jgi:alpha-ketoglutarate-dependent taurine dioxygenase
MWDNSAVLHRGRPWDSSQARYMVRATVADDGYTAGALVAA